MDEQEMENIRKEDRRKAPTRQEDTRKIISAEKYYMNVISLLGMLISVISALVIVLFLALQAFLGVENPYLEIVTLFMLPVCILFGGVLTYFGAWQTRSKHRRNPELGLPPLPRLDLNVPHNLRLIAFFALVTVIFFGVIAVASIKGFEFTESTVFCGEVCHVVMEPEHIAWSNSPHAKVKCVECHVGPGAAWYVKAKLSGMRQLYAVAFHTYPAPIETPIENLRPARETCEHCHWPEKFYAGRQKIFYHYAPNEENSPRKIDLLMHIGGNPKSPNASGIHWHINKEVLFIARDKKRLDIPYIAVKDKDGKLTEYSNIESPLTKDEIAKGNKRLMDCTDCHNRPTHIYHSPGEEMDLNFVANRIDRSLPYIKKVAVEILERPYKTKEEAIATITKEIPAYYAKNYPKIAQEKGAAINQAVDRVKDIYGKNYFPAMKVKWNTYPNYIGHFYTPGCFRCHDNKHKSADGRIISKDCKICHRVLDQTQENIPLGKQITDFVHPVDIGDELYKTNCSDCHSAGGHDVPGEGKQAMQEPKKQH